MKNLKVGKKLIFSYAVILLLMIAGIAVGIVNLIHLGTQMETFYDGPYIVKGSANIINSNFEKMQKSVYRAMANADSEIIREANQDVEDAAAAIQEQLPIIKEHFLGDQQIVERLEAALAELAPMRAQVLSLASQNQNTEAAAYMEENNILAIEKAQKELSRLIESGNTKGEQLLKGLRDSQARAALTLTILGVISFVFSILFCIYITKGITKPIDELKAAARNLADGNFSDIKITYQSEDELGMLAEDMRYVMHLLTQIVQDESYLLREMAGGNFTMHSGAKDCYAGDFQKVLLSIQQINQDLSNTLSQVHQSSELVASGSEQVSMSAQIQAQGASEQAGAVEELLVTINEISEQVEKNAENARVSNERAGAAGENAEETSAHMKAMLKAVTAIKESSDEIRSVIKTIEDIAFQTNILALNAGVEAARAGASGKGFAVIAREVRNLADKSAAASKTTAVLVENSIQSVEQGRKLADNMARSLSRAVGGIKDVGQLVNQITEASVQQAEAIRQVREGINQISEVVQTNSATAEESAAASEELSGQAQILMELVSHFVVQ